MFGDPTQPSTPQQGGGPVSQSMSDLASGLIDPSLTGGQYLNLSYATPAQRAQLYAMSQQLAQPTPIKNGWQGIASMANALVGGYYSGQADRMEQAAAAENNRQTLAHITGQSAPAPSDASPPASAPATSAAPSPAPAAAGPADAGPLMPPAPPSSIARADKVPDPANYPTTQAGQAAFIRDYAPYSGGIGIHPDFALGVANAEGLNAITPQTPNGPSGVDIDPYTKQPYSFGAFQLNVKNGLGVEARNAGIDPSDPTQANLANKYAMDFMAKNGLAPWKNDKAVEAYRATLAARTGAVPRPVQVASNGATPLPGSPTGGPMARAADGTPVQTDAQGRAIDPSTGAPTVAYAPPAASTASAPGVAAINSATNPARTPSPAIAALAAALQNRPQSATAIDPRGALAAGLTGQMPPPSPVSVAQLSGVDRLSPAAAASPRAAPAVPIAPSAATPPPNPPLPPVRPPGLGVAPQIQTASAGPPPMAASPAAAAVANAASPSAGPVPPAPVPTAPAVPRPAAPAASAAPTSAYTPQQLAYMISSPNSTPEMRELALRMATPQQLTDARGNVSIYQNGQVSAPVFHAGVSAPFDPTHPTIPGFVQDSPNGPSYSVVPPNVAGSPPGNGGASSDPPNFLDPNGPIGRMSAAAATLGARNTGIATVAQKDADEYKQAQLEGAKARDALYPLRQMQGLLESGKLPPTGHLAPNELDLRSIGNMFGVGSPDTLASLEEFRKQSGLTAVRMAQQVGASPTDFALSAAQGVTPGIGLSNQANLALNDNLIRLTDLSQKYNDAKQGWYQGHNNSLNGFQQAWSDSIDGGNAVPLSKYPIETKKGSDGKLYDRVPSTDKRGFSWAEHGTVQ
jgi:hypothetical protein